MSCDTLPLSLQVPTGQQKAGPVFRDLQSYYLVVPSLVQQLSILPPQQQQHFRTV
jgi:hypothetical protein